jgi:predicted dehydrogenase
MTDDDLRENALMPWRTAVLIGAGRMGRAHAAALRELGIKLTALCDPRAEARLQVGSEFGVDLANCFEAAGDLFKKFMEVDIVLIAATADTHASLVKLAALAGARNILCEKPFATSVVDCDAMISAASSASARLAVNHQMRFMDQYRLVKEQLAAGAIGRLASINVVGGCFGLAMNGSHYVEAFSWLTGTRPVEVSAFFSGVPLASPRGPAFFDQAGEVRILGESGQRLNLAIGADQGHGMTVTYAGSSGHIFVDELEGEMIVTSRLAEHRGAPTTRYGMPWERQSYRFKQADNVGPTRAVIEALAAGRDYPAGEDGRSVVAALAGCYASNENGHRPISLDRLGDVASRIFPWA